MEPRKFRYLKIEISPEDEIFGDTVGFLETEEDIKPGNFLRKVARDENGLPVGLRGIVLKVEEIIEDDE